MKDPHRLFRSRSDVYRALQLFFMTSSTLIAISYAFPGLLRIRWLYPVIVLWAFTLMVSSFFYGQTSQEEEGEYTPQVQRATEEPEHLSLTEQFPLRSVIPQKRDNWEEDDLV